MSEFAWDRVDDAAVVLRDGVLLHVHRNNDAGDDSAHAWEWSTRCNHLSEGNVRRDVCVEGFAATLDEGKAMAEAQYESVHCMAHAGRAT